MPRTRRLRVAVVLAGIAFTQLVLYGPSLAGDKVLLPVDLLTQPRWYLPRTADSEPIVPHNIVLSDPVLAIEIHRRFTASEIRAGRLPLWNPYNYTGTPMVRWAPLSPYNLLYALLPAPISLAWIQLLKSLVAGLGAYLFFRRVLAVGFRAAAIGGVGYPVTGFFVLWQGFPLTDVAAWFPWLLLATDRAVRRPGGWGGPALAAVTGAAVWSGKIDLAGQLLLAAGVYALWCLVDEHGRSVAGRRPILRALAAAAGGWTLGILLAMPYMLPLGEYLRTGARAAERAAGAEERPPVGLAALPQTVLPDMYGSWQKDSIRIVPGNRLSSSAAAYTGLVATLLMAPLAFASRRHRSPNFLWLVFVVVGLGWTLGVPGLVQLLRLPGLNLMSHNRLVFVASFGILALAVTGLDRVDRGPLGRRRWLWLGAIPPALLAAWSLYHSIHLPEPVASRLAQMLAAGEPVLRVPDTATLERVRQTFADHYRKDAVLGALACAGWLALWLGRRRRPPGVPLLGAVLVGELLFFAYGLSPQCDPELYYPEVEVLERLAQAPPGRVLGFDCLPPGLNQRFRLREVRGYDAVDPARLIELLDLARDPTVPAASYAPTMWLRPRYARLREDGVRLPPVLDLLGVRYLIVRGSPPAGTRPLLAGDDYWVVENPRALSRLFVPRRVREAAAGKERLELLAAEDFDPREMAYVETGVDLADDVRGTARIVGDTPTRITADLDLQAPGLVVLSDLWFPGWKASIDGEPAAVLRTNHALRGVVAPAGRSRLVWSYEPGSFAAGIRLMLAAGAGLGLWAVFLFRVRRRRSSPGG